MAGQGGVAAKPTVMVFENWRDSGRRGVVILDWSEMRDGPAPLDFDYGTPVGDGLRDANGTLIGGLYAEDYRCGQEDHKAGRPVPRMTTPSYDLGRQDAAERQATTNRLLAEIEERSRSGIEAVRAMLEPGQRATFDAQMAEVHSGRADARMAWQSLSEAQRALLGAACLPDASLAAGKGHDWHVTVAGGGVTNKALASTVRALVRRRLLAWDGDGQRVAVPTDRGRLAAELKGTHPGT